MKIALLLTGQLRTIELTKYLYMNNIISKYNTDIFISINSNNSLQTTFENNSTETNQLDIDNILSFFNPIDYFILNNNEYKIFNNNLSEFQNRYKLIVEQYYVVNKAYEMLNKHIKSTNNIYDIVIRLRFDQLIWTNDTFQSICSLFDKEKKTILFNKKNMYLLNELTKETYIKFENIENNSIYVLGYGQFKNYNYNFVNDQFFYHNHSLISLMSTFYESIEDLNNYIEENNIGNYGARIECMFDIFFRKNNIKTIKSNISGIFIREK